MPLTEAQAVKARKLWVAGKTAAEIGADFRVSRSAIIGYIWRWRRAGFEVERVKPVVAIAPGAAAAPQVKAKPVAKAKPAAKAKAAPPPEPMPAPKPARAARPKPEPIVPPPMVTPDPEPVRAPVLGVGPAVLALRAHDCRWPIGDVDAPEFRFCCDRVRPGPVGQPPYCTTHLRRAVSLAVSLRLFGSEP